MATKHPHVLEEPTFACVPSTAIMDTDHMHFTAPLLSLLSLEVPNVVADASLNFFNIIPTRPIQSLAEHFVHRPCIYLACMLLQRVIVSENYPALLKHTNKSVSEDAKQKIDDLSSCVKFFFNTHQPRSLLLESFFSFSRTAICYIASQKGSWGMQAGCSLSTNGLHSRFFAYSFASHRTCH